MMVCAGCEAELSPAKVKRGARYCSTTCCGAAYKRRYEGVAPFTAAIPSGTIGAIAELVVAADLMRRGYEVYRAISPCSGADLVVLCGSKMLRIEVRTGHRTIGGLKWPKTPRDHGRYDHYAVVLHSTGEIFYEPALPLIDDSDEDAA